MTENKTLTDAGGAVNKFNDSIDGRKLGKTDTSQKNNTALLKKDDSNLDGSSNMGTIKSVRRTIQLSQDFSLNTKRHGDASEKQNNLNSRNVKKVELQTLEPIIVKNITTTDFQNISSKPKIKQATTLEISDVCNYADQKGDQDAAAAAANQGPQ